MYSICIWNVLPTEKNYTYYTMCDNKITFDSVVQFKYCPFCGKKIEVGQNLNDAVPFSSHGKSISKLTTSNRRSSL